MATAAAAAAGDGGAAVSASGVVPISAVEALAKTLGHAEEVRAQLGEFLAAADPDALADLPPLRRARAFLALARAASSLFSAVRLRCSGINPDDHPIAKELERLCLHEEKLERFESWSKAPLRPSTTLNYQAATRFIGHSLPHLTSEQRKSMRDISRGHGVRSRPSNDRARKKRKEADRPNVRLAAQEFLEKAARELFSSKESGMKGPLRIISDEDDE
uniref:Nuclear nucleic acid-binding protein C1D n=1 Tax=Ananas comosus var. bracteatus TaxID=296719 RepID=A0A6V7NX74_ANACO|nr:unnamed protein product [Ananas comosus var. bracteatus]